MEKVDYRKMYDEFKQALKLIKEYDKIVVYRHVSPDFDAFGSQMGLATWLKLNFPEKEVHYVGESHQTFVPDLFPEPEHLDDSWYQNNKNNFLAICCDTGNSARVSEEHFADAATVIKFDHHPNHEPFGNYNIVYDQISSCSEIIALFVYSLPRKYKINKELARYLYIGIVGDTGRFLYPDVSPSTLKIAAELLATGIDHNEIYNNMYKSSFRMIEFKKYVYNHYKLSEKGTFYYVLPKEIMDELKISANEGNLVLSDFRNVEGVMACLSITETGKEGARYRVSARSNKKVIGPTMMKFNGGGHDFAAGGSINSLDELPALIKAIDEA